MGKRHKKKKKKKDSPGRRTGAVRERGTDAEREPYRKRKARSPSAGKRDKGRTAELSPEPLDPRCPACGDPELGEAYRCTVCGTKRVQLPGRGELLVRVQGQAAGGGGEAPLALLLSCGKNVQVLVGARTELLAELAPAVGEEVALLARPDEIFEAEEVDYRAAAHQRHVLRAEVMAVGPESEEQLTRFIEGPEPAPPRPAGPGGQITWPYRASNHSDILTVVLMGCLLSVLYLTFRSNAISVSFPWLLLDLGATAVCLTCAYILLAVAFNRIELRTSPQALTIRHAPLPWPGGGTVRHEAILGLTIETRYGLKQVTADWVLLAQLRSGGTLFIARAREEALIHTLKERIEQEMDLREAE